MAWFVQPSGQHSSRNHHEIEVCGACIGRTEQREQFCSEYGKEVVTVRVHRQQMISSITFTSPRRLWSTYLDKRPDNLEQGVQGAAEELS